MADDEEHWLGAVEDWGEFDDTIVVPMSAVDIAIVDEESNRDPTPRCCAHCIEFRRVARAGGDLVKSGAVLILAELRTLMARSGATQDQIEHTVQSLLVASGLDTV